MKPTTAGGCLPKGVLNWIGTGEPIQNRRYRLTLEDRRIIEGATVAKGNTEQLQSDLGFARYSVELLPEQTDLNGLT